MTASLPMYDTPVTRQANDRLWALIRDQLPDAPPDLDRTTDPHVTWQDPDLVLSQTCGLPFRSELHDRVKLVGAPDYGLTGCPPGYYRSVIVVRKDDPRQLLAEFRGATLARNDVRSQSGWAAIEGHLAENNFDFSFAESILETGGHLSSARAVAAAGADLASLDAVTWALICRDDPVSEDLRVLAGTRPTPGLPFITGPGQDAARMLTCLRNAVAGLSAADRDCLMLRDVVFIPPEVYLAEPFPPL